MASSYNRVELIGRLGHDPELRFLSEGQPLTKFSLATDRPARAGVGPETDWHHIVCWDKLAEFAGEYLSKGRLVFVAGRLAYHTYDGHDGQKRRATEIVASEVMPLDRPPKTPPDDDDETVPAADAVGEGPAGGAGPV